ncbi:MAG: hypothetical protein ABJA37_13535 [Ferruginibacter sp.]
MKIKVGDRIFFATAESFLPGIAGVISGNTWFNQTYFKLRLKNRHIHKPVFFTLLMKKNPALHLQ